MTLNHTLPFCGIVTTPGRCEPVPKSLPLRRAVTNTDALEYLRKDRLLWPILKIFGMALLGLTTLQRSSIPRLRVGLSLTGWLSSECRDEKKANSGYFLYPQTFYPYIGKWKDLTVDCVSSLMTYSTFLARSTLFIEFLFVLSDYRGKGWERLFSNCREIHETVGVRGI